MYSPGNHLEQLSRGDNKVDWHKPTKQNQRKVQSGELDEICIAKHKFTL